MWKFLGLLFLLITSGCSIPTPASTATPSLVAKTQTGSPGPNWENPLHLTFREKIILNDGFQITFSDILEDSRCPAGAQCIRAGNAQISLTIQTASGNEVKLVLNTDPKLAQQASIDGHSVQLVQIAPDQPIAAQSGKSSYEIWLNVLVV